METGLRRFAAKIDRPIVVYVKQEGYVTPGEIARMVDDGLVAWVKYAIVRPDPADDSFLKRLVDVISPSRVVSGIGEQPALVHMRDFKLVSFTSGCVCIAPALPSNCGQLAGRRLADGTEDPGDVQTAGGSPQRNPSGARAP